MTDSLEKLFVVHMTKMPETQLCCPCFDLLTIKIWQRVNWALLYCLDNILIVWRNTAITYFLDSSGDRVSLLSVDKHPTQPHLLAAGGQDGVLSIWDMRQELYPVTLLEAHNAESKTLFLLYFL